MTDPKPVRYVPTISFGNVLAGLMAVVAVAVAWGAQQSSMAAQDKRLAAVEVAIAAEQSARTLQRDKLEAAIAMQDARLRAQEILTSGMASDLRSALAGITRIETSVSKLVSRP